MTKVRMLLVALLLAGGAVACEPAGANCANQNAVGPPLPPAAHPTNGEVSTAEPDCY